MPRTFQISEAHLAAFSAQQRERFVREMIVYLKEVYPDETKKLGDGKLREIIATGIDKSKSYDILLERDVARYIEFMIAIAPDFDVSPKTPWAKEILLWRNRPANIRLDQIERREFEPGAGGSVPRP